MTTEEPHTSAMFMLVRIANKTISRAGLSSGDHGYGLVETRAWASLQTISGRRTSVAGLSPALQRNRFFA